MKWHIEIQSGIKDRHRSLDARSIKLNVYSYIASSKLRDLSIFKKNCCKMLSVNSCPNRARPIMDFWVYSFFFFVLQYLVKNIFPLNKTFIRKVCAKKTEIFQLFF